MLIRSVGDYLHTVHDGSGLPSLSERLTPLCRIKYRRIDRFIQLALLGSAECAVGRTLAPDCALYLASGVGPVGNNITVQESIGRDRKAPMPFNFVNTLGSSAGYYVATNLGLSGQSLIVSRRGDSFGAALSLAETDFAAGLTTQALVGAVEECTLPLSEHRSRQKVATDTILAEGSHWFLLEPGTIANGVAVDRAVLESADVAFHDSREAALVGRYVVGHAENRFGFERQGARWQLVQQQPES